jgi:hypothetical protein
MSNDCILFEKYQIYRKKGNASPLLSGCSICGKSLRGKFYFHFTDKNNKDHRYHQRCLPSLDFLYNTLKEIKGFDPVPDSIKNLKGLKLIEYKAKHGEGHLIMEDQKGRTLKVIRTFKQTGWNSVARVLYAHCSACGERHGINMSSFESAILDLKSHECRGDYSKDDTFSSFIFRTGFEGD